MFSLEELDRNGWCEIFGVKTETDLLEISNSIGRIIPHPTGENIFKLRPSNGLNSAKNTLSRLYGYGEFPLHTDTAFWHLPARYMMLSSFFRSEASTLLFDTQNFVNILSQVEYNEARASIFLVKTNGSQSYTSFFFREDNILGVRFDLGCMHPLNLAAIRTKQRLTNYITNGDVDRYFWNGETAIIVDNWRMLHGRSSTSKTEMRELNRIYLTKV